MTTIGCQYDNRRQIARPLKVTSPCSANMVTSGRPDDTMFAEHGDVSFGEMQIDWIGDQNGIRDAHLHTFRICFLATGPLQSHVCHPHMRRNRRQSCSYWCRHRLRICSCTGSLSNKERADERLARVARSTGTLNRRSVIRTRVWR